MVSYFIRYRGSSSDPGAFNAHYQTGHAEILRQFPNIRSLILHRPTAWMDPLPIRPGGTFLLAQMVFETANELDAALRSPARREARDDFARFPPFEGDVTHEAMVGTVVF